MSPKQIFTVQQRKLLIKVFGDVVVGLFLLKGTLEGHQAIDYWKWSTVAYMGANAVAKFPPAILNWIGRTK